MQLTPFVARYRQPFRAGFTSVLLVCRAESAQVWTLKPMVPVPLIMLLKAVHTVRMICSDTSHLQHAECCLRWYISVVSSSRSVTSLVGVITPTSIAPYGVISKAMMAERVLRMLIIIHVRHKVVVVNALSWRRRIAASKSSRLGGQFAKTLKQTHRGIT